MRYGLRICILVLLAANTAVSPAADPSADTFTQLADQFANDVRPLLQQYCLECHSSEVKEGELDLERFASLDDVRGAATIWQQVVELLADGEMPPKDFPTQPTDDERQRLLGWARRYLDAEALANAGDPGPVVLRRLNNAEYTYTIRDLTGVDLEPAREFPSDSAAGEGFTNAGGALVMSPALLEKYFDAGKEIARHAVLLPDGFRFSPSTTQQDWTNETLDRIREIYRQHSTAGGTSTITLQGLVFESHDEGRLNIEPYLVATVVERSALEASQKSIADVARQRGLNAKYLGILWTTLRDSQPSPVLDEIRARWRAASTADDARTLAKYITEWQQSLWYFASVGHIGKVGGPKAWQEPLSPLAKQHDVRIQLPSTAENSEVTLYLVASDAGDGNDHDDLVWHQPRLVARGRPDILLRDVRPLTLELRKQREQLFASTTRLLEAAAAAADAPLRGVAELAEQHDVSPEALTAWLELLGIRSSQPVMLEHLAAKMTSASGYDFVQGWSSPDLPALFANSSDNHVRIPGNMKPHGVCVHPTPTHVVATGWRSPIAGSVEITGTVTHAHPECGNGVEWFVELRRGTLRERIASGATQGPAPDRFGPFRQTIEPGDLISLVIGPRDREHSCDLTDLEFVLTEVEAPGESGNSDGPRVWSLTADVSSDVLSGNPHADRYGNRDVWHFYREALAERESAGALPAGSLIARWKAAQDPDKRRRLAEAVERLLTEGPEQANESHPDVLFYRQVSQLDGPLLLHAWTAAQEKLASQSIETSDTALGLDPQYFGRHPDGASVDPASICTRAPSVIEVRLPTDLLANAEFVTAPMLHPETGREGSVQVRVATAPLGSNANKAPLVPTGTNTQRVAAAWTANIRDYDHQAPILVTAGSAAERRMERAFAEFREIFPIALCYTKIVPVDEVVTLTLYHREDEHLQRLMLDEAQSAELDRLWNELHFISHDAIQLVDALEQLIEYATQDADPSVFEPLREPFRERAEQFRAALEQAEPRHLDALVAFADRAFRRPLHSDEEVGLRDLYAQLREQGLPHEEAFRLTLARVFISPSFLYRLESASPPGQTRAEKGDGERHDETNDETEVTARGVASHPVSSWELASRLSYFLWSSPPDDELRAVAESGELVETDVLLAQTRRMLLDQRVRRMATEFGCQWLHVYEFAAHGEKSEQHFPEFADLRADMYEEVILFFTDMLQHDRSLLEVLTADYTFANERLAAFYGLSLDDGGTEPVATREGWYRVREVRQQGRGGILGFAATLAKQSGASRTSPTLRGNWIAEVLLGDRLPNPPPDVPQLPDDGGALDQLTVREMVELHARDPRCAHCHVKVDPFGFALENYDAIGRYRTRDAQGRKLDTRTALPDGTQIEGPEALRDYLLERQRDVFVRQFCRKLLGYALGRSVQLSDEPLLTEMQQKMAKNDYRISAAIESIVTSRQFREIRTRP